MAYEEYDKLAWALVKDEIRRLVKPRDPMGLEETLARIIKPNKLGFYRAQGALSDAGLKRARRDVLQAKQSILSTFGHSSSRARLEDGGGMMTVDSSFTWDFKELGVTDYQDTNRNRQENLLELRHLNFGIGKRKMILDMISCFILVNHHTLYRLIQRGAINREPIALLSRKFDDWSGYAAMFMLSNKFLGDQIGNNVFIPLCGGALLGKIAFTESSFTEQGWDRHRLRFMDSIYRGQIETSPIDNIIDDEFEGRPGSVTLQICTWIPDHFYHGEQEWAHDQIQRFVNKHKDIVGYCADGIFGRYTKPSKKRDAAFSTSAEEFGQDLGRIFSDRRWAIACQWI